jgi:hypothetical protein
MDVSSRSEEVNVHHLVAYEIYKDRVAAIEREAEMRRLLPRKERRRFPSLRRLWASPSVQASSSQDRHPRLEPSRGGC